MMQYIWVIIGIFIVGSIIIKILSNPVLLCVVVITAIVGYFAMITSNPIAILVFAVGALLAAGGISK